MKTIALVLLLIAILICVYFFVLGQKSKSGNAPGLVQGALSQCSDKPNCVCSEQSAQDDPAYITPLPIKGTVEQAMESIKNAVEQAGGVISEAEEQYLAATFTSGIFSFVDDLEIRIDPAAQVMHIRSASRVGHSDLGANRKRVENIRKIYEG